MARQRGNSWQADAYIGTKRVRQTFKTKADAEAFEKQAVAIVDTKNVGTILPQLATELWADKKSWVDADRITREWVRRLGSDLPVYSITDTKIDTIISDLRAEGNARQTINNKLTRLSKLLKRCQRKRLIQSVPFIELQNGYSGRIRFLTTEEEERLFSYLPENEYYFARFLLFTGCRVGEALALEWRDVADTGVTFWVTKGNKARTIPLNTPVREALAYYQGGNSTVFSRIVYSTFLKRWNKAVERMGLSHDPQVVPHVLRHTCCSRLVQRGVDIRRVKEWMGHASINTTMRYAHLAPKDLEQAANVLEQGVNLVTKPVTNVTKKSA